MDLNTFSLPELRKLRSKVDVEISRRQSAGRKALLKRIQKMAAEEGLTLQDVLGDSTPAVPTKERKRAVRGSAKASAKPKKTPLYFHPTAPGIGWSGHGRRPAWVIEWMDAGNALEGLMRKAEA